MWKPLSRHAVRGLGTMPRICLLLFLLGTGVTPVGASADALYWRILRGEAEVGFLLGTIHSEDPRVLDFSEGFLAQLASCEVFAMEMVPDLPTLTRLSEYMHFQDGTTLERQLGAERAGRVMQALEHYQVPADWKAKMKVWAAMMTLSVPPPQTGFFMDFALSLRAAGGGLQVKGLETLEQQLSFLENMPMTFQVRLLDLALDDYAKVQSIHDLMVDTYLAGSLAGLEGQLAQQFERLEPDLRDYFLQQGIVERNRRMLASLLPLLERGRVLAAVGALHLPGDAGLVNLLREAGYRLEPQPSPLNAASAEPLR